MYVHVFLLLKLFQAETILGIIRLFRLYIPGTMDEIIEKLFIGSLVQASDLNLLHQNNITAVVSIGCEPEPFDRVSYCSFPQYLDMPESRLLEIFLVTTDFIDSQLNRGNGVLVHCVYGQSRSATVIAAYLVMSCLMTLDEALDLLQEKHSSICINPGFLSQLDLFFRRKEYSAEFGLLFPENVDYKASTLNIADPEDTNLLTCVFCDFMFGLFSDVLRDRDNAAYIHKRTDPFWSGYTSAHRKVGITIKTLAEQKYIATTKLSTLSRQIESARTVYGKEVLPTRKKRKRGAALDGIPLTCPGCNQKCGFFKPNGLLLCNSFLLGDLVALSIDAIKNPFLLRQQENETVVLAVKLKAKSEDISEDGRFVGLTHEDGSSQSSFDGEDYFAP